MSNIVDLHGHKIPSFYKTFVRTVRPIENIELEQTDWIVKKFLARGHVTMVVGGPGTCKTTFAVAMCAKLTNYGPKDRVLLKNIAYFGPEVNFGQQVKANYSHQFGNMDGTLWCTTMEDPEAEWDLTHLAANMDRVINHVGAELIIVDTFITFSGKYDTNKAEDVKKLLLPLRIASREHNIAVLVLAHTRKGTKGRSWENAAGSHQIAGQVSVLAELSRYDPEDRKKMVLHVEKSNIGPDYVETRMEREPLDPKDWEKGITVKLGRFDFQEPLPPEPEEEID